MPDLAMMRRHLAQAEQDISLCEQQVETLRRRVERAEVLKANTEHARKLLRLLVDALAVCVARRLTILQTIARLERRESSAVDLWQRTNLADLSAKAANR